jgi:hypothetical protein
MKQKKWLLLICTFAAGNLIVSCAKDPQIDHNPKPTLSFSKTSVKIGEPLYATSTGGPAGTTVQWITGANGQVWSSAGSDTATFLFTSPGVYDVKAVFHSGSSLTGYDSSNTSVTVIDSVFSDTSTAHCDVIVQKTLDSNDQVNLTPVSFSDTGLIFVAHTQHAYSHSPILDCGGNLPPAGGTFECDFNSTFLFACYGSTLPSPAVGIVSFTSVSIGTYNLVFKLNGTSYSGSLTVTATQASIVWNNSTGVTISPLTIQKQ